MKKKLLIFLLVIMALVPVSCVQDIWQEESKQKTESAAEEGLVERSFEINFETGTRATLNGNTPVWEVGEEVSVYDPVAAKERIFTVTKVEGVKATITGSISEGNFPFSAVYPASSATKWNSIDNCTITIPETQIIKSDRTIDPKALVSCVYSADETEQILFSNCVSLLQFKVTREEVESVSIELKGSSAKSYSVSCSGCTFDTESTYYLAVEPGEYTSGIKLSCTTIYDVSFNKISKNVLNAKRNGQLNLGVVSDGVKHVNYTVTKTGGFDNFDAYCDAIGISDDETFNTIKTSVLTKTIYNSILNKHFPINKQAVTSICFTYKSINPQNLPVTQSAYLIFPNQALSGTKANGTIIVSHASHAKYSEAPTESTEIEAGLVWMNYAVVIPDYYGFGASRAYPQAYLNPEVSARSSIDAYEAAMQILADREASVGSNIYNIGYSQGAFNALANVKYISEHPERGIKFKQTFAGGGPYDVEMSYNEFLSGKYPETNPWILVSVVSFKECEKLDIPYSDIFQEPLLSNYDNWINSKNYSSTSFMNKIGTDDLSKILTPGLYGKTGTAFNAIMNVCRRYSLTEGSWKPADGSKIYLYHSEEDDMVPYANLTSIRNYFNSVSPKDCTIKYTDMDDVSLPISQSVLKLFGFTSITHMTGAGFFFYDAIANKWEK